MAKKKKSGGKKKSKSSGSKSSKKNAPMLAAGVAVGVIGSRLAETYIEKQWPGKVSNKMKAIGEVAAGVVVGLNPFNVKFLDNPFIQGIGFGMGAQGVATGAKELGVISGSEAPLYLTNRKSIERINGANGNGQKKMPYYNVPRVGERNRPGNPSDINVIGKRRKMSGAETMYY